MKYLNQLLLACALLLSIAACNKDNESSDLEGTWKAVDFTATVTTSSEFQGQTFENLTEITDEALSYDLVLDGSKFTTNGDYDFAVKLTSDGSVIFNDTQNYTNVMGSGTYSTDGDKITVDGQFFDFMVNGQNYLQTTGPVTATFEINADGQLIFSQNETTTDMQSGTTTTSTVIATSTWERK